VLKKLTNKTDNIVWDYSKIPNTTFQWFIEEDHWIDLELDGRGLDYMGTDYGSLSGGRYMAGFQNIQTFLIERAINKMPKNIEEKIQKLIEKHRNPGGVELNFIHENCVKEIKLINAYVNLDERSVYLPFTVPEEDSARTLLYSGSIMLGKHKLSCLLAFETSKNLLKLKSEIEFEIQPGITEIYAKTVKNLDGLIELEIKIL
jgi:hypothetical protein